MFLGIIRAKWLNVNMVKNSSPKMLIFDFPMLMGESSKFLSKLTASPKRFNPKIYRESSDILVKYEYDVGIAYTCIYLIIQTIFF